MNCRYYLTVILLLAFVSSAAWAQESRSPAFSVVPLGVKGGLDESNLSAYMLAAAGTDAYVCLDAGTLHAGIRKGIEQGSFSVAPDAVLKNYIKAYLLSHAHIDHLAGLVTNSPDDSRKNIYALPGCIAILKNHYFNGESWPNMGDEGAAPVLKKYHYHPLQPRQETPIDQTDLSVRTFPLSHAHPYESAAFLIRSGGNYALYLGDTGPDEVEKSTDLAQLWRAVASLIKSKALRVIFMEVSYPSEQPDKQLYGHLTPRWLMKEVANLSALTGPQALKDFPIVITHIKPTGNNEATIRRQLAEANTLGLQLIYPEQGKRLEF